jgi:hypothetical protein
MSLDFRTNAIQANKLIASGSSGTPAQLIVYPIAADGTPANQGNINSGVFDTTHIGSDIFAYFSGSVGSTGISGSHGAVVFGGDMVVSGSVSFLGTSNVSLNKSPCNYGTVIDVQISPSTGQWGFSGGVLTAFNNGAFATPDTSSGSPITSSLNDRVLVLVGATGPQGVAAHKAAGIYTITTLGGVSTPAVLTRAVDANTSNLVKFGLNFLILAGDGLKGVWAMQAQTAITLNTTALDFFQLVGAGGGGSVQVDHQTIGFNGNGEIAINGLGVATANIADFAVTSTKINTNAVGGGLTGGGGSAISVFPDPTANNPLSVSPSGVLIRAGSVSQSGYISSSDFVKFNNVAKYVGIPGTIGSYPQAVLQTVGTGNAQFALGALPANTFWTVKFQAFSVDTGSADNHVVSIGTMLIYRNGSNNAVQIGNIEIDHLFYNGSFTSMPLSTSIGTGGSGPGGVSLDITGILTYTINHWIKYEITEFVFV